MSSYPRKSPIDRLRRILYGRNEIPKGQSRHDIHIENQTNVTHDWGEEKFDVPENFTMPSRRNTYRVLFRLSLALFIIALLAALYSFFGGKVFVSSNNVDMTVSGPVSVAGGAVTDLTVTVENKNKTDIELVDLIAVFPAGAKNPDYMTKEAGRELISLGAIKAGGSAKHAFHVVFFGAEGTTQIIKFTVNYHTHDSNAVFYKQKDAEISIASSPVSLSVEGLDSISSGEPTTLKFTVTSNSLNVIQDVALEVSYPFGWTTFSSDTKASSGENIWDIGDLAAGATKNIIVSGKIDGQNGDQETVRARVGLKNQKGSIGVAMISAEHTFSIEKPFLAITLSLDGNQSENYAAAAGKVVNATVRFENLTATRIKDASIVVALSGNVLDPSSVNTSEGYYNSQVKTITWDGGRNAALSLVPPEANGEFHFSFASFPNISNVKNAEVDLDVAVKGDRIDESNVSENVGSEITRKVKIVSNLSLSSRLVRSGTAIANTGPIPPKADQTTTYSVIWIAANTSNNVSNVKVSGTLPPYVKFTGVAMPSASALSYSSGTGSIIWNAGSIPTGATKEIDFQVALTPSVTDVGTAPSIMGSTMISGIDDFAGVKIQSSVQDLSTLTQSDPSFVPGNEIVGK